MERQHDVVEIQKWMRSIPSLGLTSRSFIQCHCYSSMSLINTLQRSLAEPIPLDGEIRSFLMQTCQSFRICEIWVQSKSLDSHHCSSCKQIFSQSQHSDVNLLLAEWARLSLPSFTPFVDSALILTDLLDIWGRNLLLPRLRDEGCFNGSLFEMRFRTRPICKTDWPQNRN